MDLINDWGDRIGHRALQWAGKSFAAGVTEQCMNWVRHVLEQVEHPYAARVTSHPVDGHWTGASIASSLAGRDLGEMVVKVAELELGDLVVFNDTYTVPGFGAGTITHVGIALGPRDFIHRPTAARPVERASFAGYWASKFRAATRVPQRVAAAPGVKAPLEAATAKIWLNGNGSAFQLRSPLDRGSYSLYSTGSAADGGWLTKLVERAGPVPGPGVNQLWVNDKGMAMTLREQLDPGSYSLVSAGSDGGGWNLKLVPR